MLGSRPPNNTPWLQITEEPKQRGMRFRYECEGRSAGSIPGEKATQDRKSWPSIKVHNCNSEVNIRVSLVSKDIPPRPHPHSLVGKDCDKGICQVVVSPDTQMLASFSNLGIQCVKRKEVLDSLRERQRLRVNPFNTFSDPDDRPTVDIDLATVRLCFEGFIIHSDRTTVLQPVLSKTIYDKKATASSLLRICRVDRSFGTCKGGTEIYLLCDKVQKDDISVCFYDKGWEAYGEFSPTDVHRQVAIVFRTPPYKDQHLRAATKVYFQLKRTSDGETSDPKEFMFLPRDHDQPIVPLKRSHEWESRPTTSSHVHAAIKKRMIENRVKQMGADGAGWERSPVTQSQMMPSVQPFPGQVFEEQMSSHPAQLQTTDPTPLLPEDVLNNYLTSNLSPNSPFNPQVPGFSPNLQAFSQPPQYSSSQVISQYTSTHVSTQYPNNPAATPTHFSSSQGASFSPAWMTESSNFPVTTGQMMPFRTSLPQNYAVNAVAPGQIFPNAPLSTGNYEPSFLEIPGIDSISSLKNVSFGNTGIDPDNLTSDLGNLSIEEIPGLVKKEPTENTFSPMSYGQSGSVAHNIQQQYQPQNPNIEMGNSFQMQSTIPLSPAPSYPLSPASNYPLSPPSNLPQQPPPSRPTVPSSNPLQQSLFADNVDTIPSFDLTDPQGQFSIDASQTSDIDELMQNSSSNQ